MAQRLPTMPFLPRNGSPNQNPKQRPSPISFDKLLSSTAMLQSKYNRSSFFTLSFHIIVFVSSSLTLQTNLLSLRLRLVHLRIFVNRVFFSVELNQSINGKCFGTFRTHRLGETNVAAFTTISHREDSACRVQSQSLPISIYGKVICCQLISINFCLVDNKKHEGPINLSDDLFFPLFGRQDVVRCLWTVADFSGPSGWLGQRRVIIAASLGTELEDTE
jgi:hypothetical protein